MSPYILALDQGTTSSRAIIFDRDGNMAAVAQKEFAQHFPQPGWVEHDPMEIWSSQISVAAEAMSKIGVGGDQIAAIGITNQRETTIVWHRETGQPIYNAIVWQDRRTAPICDALRANGHAETIREKTGLVLDAYFSATKVQWILDNVAGARDLANQGKLAFGTVDSWLVWQLTGAELHITDVSNASRTMLFNIHTMQWDNTLLELLNIPPSMLPEVRDSSEIYGYTKANLTATRIPIAGIAGDQQAALFGQMCTVPGMVKNTYGTGCFMMMNTGITPCKSENKLLTTVAWRINGVTNYALEGSIFIGGAVVQWLRDGLGIIKKAADIEALAASVADTGGVYVVPAFAGLGAPYWDQHARGTLLGLTRGTTNAHIALAALEAIAYQTMDVVEAMRADAKIPLAELRVDGGATANNLLMQIQANILGTPVVRPKITETTALGAAYLAGLAVGFWTNTDELQTQWAQDRRFEPAFTKKEMAQGKKTWKRAVKATRTF